MNAEEIEERLESLKWSHDRLMKEATYIVDVAIRDASIKTHSVSGRVKALDSVLAKMRRKGMGGSLDALGDLVGIRVVCLFREDLVTLGDIIRREFVVESEDDKVEGASISAFGYQSIHFVVKIKTGCKGRRYDGLHKLRCEIQVRTVAMDTWATLSHYLDYKSEADVPVDLRKDFFALSGLFYVADTHFQLFYEARQRSVSASLEAAAAKTPLNEQELNIDSLGAYLQVRYPDRRHSSPGSVSEVLSEVTSEGYLSLASVDGFLERSAVAFAEYEVSNPPGNVFGDESARYSDVGTVRMSLAIANPAYCKSKGFGRMQSFIKNRERRGES